MHRRDTLPDPYPLPQCGPMRPNHPARSRNSPWDDNQPGHHPQRALRLHPDTRSRLLRAAQSKPCAQCGNRVEWYYRPDGRPVPLHPHELPVLDVPEHLRWHLDGGVAHPLPDGTAWCRIPHHVVCPATEPPSAQLGRLVALRRRHAVHTRRLLDTGRFTPRATPAPMRAPAPEPERRRDIVQLFYSLYLAPGPAAQTPCVAFTVRRQRCPYPLTHQAWDIGAWTTLPVPASRRGQLTEHLTDTPMAVYDLSHLPYTSQLRWRAQHCPAHADSGAPDIAVTAWEPFDAFAHHQHITPTVPHDHPAAGEGAR